MDARPEPLSPELPATVSMTLADFVNVDDTGKANMVGAGLRILTVTPAGTASVPFAVWATVALPTRPAHPVIVELTLAAANGDSVRIADGDGGSIEVRIARTVRFTSGASPEIDVPAGVLPATHVIAANFSSGLHFAAGAGYRWQIELDGQVAAVYPFYVTTEYPSQ